MFVVSILLLVLTLSNTTAGGLDSTLQTFVQRVVPEGGIVFWVVYKLQERSTHYSFWNNNSGAAFWC